MPQRHKDTKKHENFVKECYFSFMDSLTPFGKIFIILGIVLLILGVLFLFSDKIPFFGKLPGDIVIKKKNFTVYIPIATSILLSIILTIIFYFINKK